MLEERLGTTPKRDRTLEIDGEYFIVIVLQLSFCGILAVCTMLFKEAELIRKRVEVFLRNASLGFLRSGSLT